MSDEINYKNNPLNGVGLKKMLVELTDYYGFDILFAYLNINCFKNNPSVASSVKFLKKTDWAREKVEAFYLYSFKSLPKASYQDSQLSPRDRIIPDDQSPGEPANLSLNDAAKNQFQKPIILGQLRRIKILVIIRKSQNLINMSATHPHQ